MNERFSYQNGGYGCFEIRRHVNGIAYAFGSVAQEDMARRIAAALNAVEGIPTESLEGANIPAAIEEIARAMQIVAEGPLAPADAVAVHRALDDARTYCGHIAESKPQP